MSVSDRRIEFDVDSERRTALVFGNSDAPETFVFLHGIFVGPKSYSTLGNLLAAANPNIRIVIPALPGLTGTAPLPPGKVNLGGYCEYVMKTVKAIGVEGPFWIGGHSMGGGIASAVAMLNGDRVNGLLAFNPKTRLERITPRAVLRAVQSVDHGTGFDSTSASAIDSMHSFALFDRNMAHLPRRRTDAFDYAIEVLNQMHPRSHVDRISDATRNVLDVLIGAASMSVVQGPEELTRSEIPVWLYLGESDSLTPYKVNLNFGRRCNATIRTYPARHIIGPWIPPFVRSDLENDFRAMTASRCRARVARPARPCLAIDPGGAKIVRTRTTRTGTERSLTRATGCETNDGFASGP